MKVEAILSSFCYFSIFFAPFLFPIVVYFVVRDEETKSNAKKAFLSHLLPLAAAFLIVLLFIAAGGDPGIAIITVGLVFFLLSFIVFIWNIVRGIQVLLDGRES